MGKVWDVAVIGAGMAGLGAGRLLHDSGRDIILLDKGRAPGGRVCSRYQDGCVFDHGAQNVKANGSELENAVATFPRDLVQPFDAPVMLHKNGTVHSGDEGSNREVKWVTRGGLATLTQELARDLPVWTGTRVAHLQESEGNFELYGDGGLYFGRANKVLITAPAPQTAALLAASTLRESAQSRIEALSNVDYNRCLTVMLRYAAALEVDWYALLAEDRSHPLLWLAHENAKGYVLPAEQTALVAQLGPQVSQDLYEARDEDIVAQTQGWLREATPELHNLPTPAWSSVKRWRYAQSHDTADWADLNPDGSKIVIAGDALCAKSRVELAYESGVRAARQLLVE